MAGFPAIALSVDVTRSFGIENGTMIFDETTGEKAIWYGGGSVAPNIFPGVDVPLGSSYRQTNGDIWAKTGVGPMDWTLDGLGSAVVTQTADFGKSGNASSNSYLNRAGNVPSNVSGIIILPTTSSIRIVACGQENIDTYSVEFYEHEGDFINPTLLYTLSVVSSRSGSASGLNIPVTQGEQLAAKVLNSVKNVGCSVGIKGLSL